MSTKSLLKVVFTFSSILASNKSVGRATRLKVWLKSCLLSDQVHQGYCVYKCVKDAVKYQFAVVDCLLKL